MTNVLIIFLWVILLSSINTIFAEPKNTNNKDVSIPFMVNKDVSTKIHSEYTQNMSRDSSVNETTKEISGKVISAFIKDIKTSICGAVGDSEVKVCISASAEGGLFVAKAIGESGIEVAFKCKDIT